MGSGTWKAGVHGEQVGGLMCGVEEGIMLGVELRKTAGGGGMRELSGDEMGVEGGELRGN